jgi:hypothetical protein
MDHRRHEKVDAAQSPGFFAIGLLGAWNWRGKNDLDGALALPDWGDIALKVRKVSIALDSDVTTKPRLTRSGKQGRAGAVAARWRHAPNEASARTDPRWGVGTEETRWYPQHRLFQQDQPADWDSLIEQVKYKLEQEIRHDEFRRT